MNWRDEVLKEAAGGPRASCVTVDVLVKSPGKVSRVGKDRRSLCEGGCGRRVWEDYCRKCRRKMAKALERRRRN